MIIPRYYGLTYHAQRSLTNLESSNGTLLASGSTAFKVQKDGCGVPSAARALLGPEGLLMR